MASEGSTAPVRWGLLGTGDITNKVTRGARRSDRVQFVAVGSRTPERAEAYAGSHDVPRAHGSYEALLDDPDVEAVYISLPNSLHHEWTMHALRAGKHVLCEKPYSTRVEDVEEAYNLANARNLVLSEGFMWRHHPQATALKALLPELGELQTIRATFSFVLHFTGRSFSAVLPFPFGPRHPGQLAAMRGGTRAKVKMANRRSKCFIGLFSISIARV